MKICQLSHVESSFNFVAPLVHALLERGHDVVAACTLDHEGSELRRYLGTGLDIDRVRVARRVSVRTVTVDVAELAAYLHRERFDVLHVHSPLVSMQGRLAARLAGVPVVVYTAHGFYFHDGMSRVRKTAHRTLERTFARLFTDYLITVNTEDSDVARGWARRGGATVVPIPGVGVDTHRFRPADVDARRTLRTALGAVDDDVVVAFVGRLVGEKGIVELAEAFAAAVERDPCLRLWLVGELHRSERDRRAMPIVEQVLASPAVFGRTTFLGHCDDVLPILQASDVFALPSYREGMPVALLEAMACALPVVATDVRGCREAVDEGRTGLLVPPREPLSLAEALLDLGGDELRRRAMGRCGRERVVERFDLARSLALQLQMYDRISEALAGSSASRRSSPRVAARG